MIKQDDIVKVISKGDLWYGYYGRVLETGTYGVLVELDKPSPRKYRTIKSNLQRVLPKLVLLKQLNYLYV